MSASSYHRLLIVTVGLVLCCWPSESAAYNAYRASGGEANCSGCHPGFLNRGPLHDVHVGNTRMTNNCLLCHFQPGDIPRTWISLEGEGCRGCHGRDNGTDFSWGAGLRQHHAAAGVPPDGNGLFCANCHQGDPSPLPENVLPVYYTRADVNVKNPCSANTADGEDWEGDLEGLDNDGDLVYDANDDDCSTTGIESAPAPAAAALVMLAIAPNPAFGDGTQIRYSLAERADVTVAIYDMAGRLVMKETTAGVPPGEHAAVFDRRDRVGGTPASGVYGVRVSAGSSVVWGRVVFIR